MSDNSENWNARIEWIKNILKSIKPDSRILDAGAGELFYKQYCSHLKYVSQDFAKYNPNESNVGLQINNWNYNELNIVSDIVSIPEPDHSFDAILCTEVLEHIPNPILALKEFFRLLKPDGLLIITAPFCSITHFAPYHYYSGFSKFFYESHLQEQGFAIIELSYNGNYFDFLKQELSRISSVCTKYKTKARIRYFEKKAIGVLYKLLTRLSKNDNGSHELLTFGYHILAKKL